MMGYDVGYLLGNLSGLLGIGFQHIQTCLGGYGALLPQEFSQKPCPQVGESRLVRAQARAVVSEMKKAASSDTASAK